MNENGNRLFSLGGGQAGSGDFAGQLVAANFVRLQVGEALQEHCQPALGGQVTTEDPRFMLWPGLTANGFVAAAFLPCFMVIVYFGPAIRPLICNFPAHVRQQVVGGIGEPSMLVVGPDFDNLDMYRLFVGVNGTHGRRAALGEEDHFQQRVFSGLSKSSSARP